MVSLYDKIQDIMLEKEEPTLLMQKINLVKFLHKERIKTFKGIDYSGFNHNNTVSKFVADHPTIEINISGIGDCAIEWDDVKIELWLYCDFVTDCAAEMKVYLLQWQQADLIPEETETETETEERELK